MATASQGNTAYFDDDWGFAPAKPAETGSSEVIKPASKVPKGLTPFKPGQSGNPSGRKKSLPITDALRAELEREMPGADGKTVAEALAKKLISIAAGRTNAAIRALEVILDRAEGKVVQRQEVSGVDGAPMVFESVGSRQEVEQMIALLLSAAQERRLETQAQATAEPVPKVIEGQTVVARTAAAKLLSQIVIEPVQDSSNVAGAGYDPVGRTLLVRYKNGGVNVWRGIILEEEYKELMAAGSPGQYMRMIEARHGAGVKVAPAELELAAGSNLPTRGADIDLNWW